jgi:hypothetical protein
MNIYVVVEGDAEARVYPRWIPLVNPTLSHARTLDDVVNEQFYVISGRGYPQYFQVIADAIEDVNASLMFDRLVVAVDSEEMTYEDKLAEMQARFVSTFCRVPIHWVIQHFCFETWALGNRKALKPVSQSQRLRDYRAIHDVRREDPELLPPLTPMNWNRSAFALRYLVAVLNEHFRNLTYTKRSPGPVMHQKFYAQLVARKDDTGHIGSFSDFLRAFN